MKPILLLTPLVLALGLSVHAQSPDALMLQTYQSLPNPLPHVDDLTWQSESGTTAQGDRLVAFKVPSAPAGSHTRLFVHVTLDQQHNPPFLVKALHGAYPFLLPAQAASSAVATLVGSTTLMPGGAAECNIPANRVRDHLLKSSSNLAEFGPMASSGPEVLTWTRPVAVPASDERAPWPSPGPLPPTWTNRTTPINDIARSAIIMACQQAFPNNSTAGASALGDLLQNDYVYSITIQGVQVKPRTGGGRDIKFTQTVRMTRFSLKWDVGDPWFMAHGPLRTLPSIAHNPLRHFLVAEQGGEFHAELWPGEVIPTGTIVVALIQGDTGWTTTRRLVNQVSNHDHMMRFPCPDNAASGFYYVGYQYPQPDGTPSGPIYPLKLKHAYEGEQGPDGSPTNPYAVMVMALQP